MMLQRGHGILFMALGAASIVDGSRITREAREGANFDAIGPDRYLMALGVLMLATGLWRLLGRPGLDVEGEGAVAARATGARSTLVLTLATLAGFAALTPAVGFSLACLVFLAVEFWLLGEWPWWKSASAAAVGAAAFHAVFVRLADMPLPKGYLWE